MPSLFSGLLRRILKPSLPLLFFRYYLSALLALVLIITVVGIVIDKAYNNIDEESGRNFMRGTITLLSKELTRYPENEWADQLKQLSPSFSYPLHLERLSGLDTLDAAAREELRRNAIHLDMDALLIYARIRDSDKVLVLGPLNITPNGDLLTEENQMQILWWILTGLGFGILMFLGIRPLWNDLVSIRRTAERLAEGDFNARSPHARSWLLAPLSRALNGMADRIEEHITSRQASAQAVAHELRTPIARLRFGLTMLEEADTPEEAMHYRAGMSRDVDELDNLVNASLRYARLNRGDVTLHPVSVELAAWTAGQTDSLAHQVPAQMVLHNDITPQQVSFDEQLIQVALRNLLTNALRYANAQVRLSAETRDGMVFLYVDDDGPGVPPAERERIFEPFQRLDRSRDRATGGYGLGLSFVRLIAEHHGGASWVEDAPEGGARFVLCLPVAVTVDGGTVTHRHNRKTL